MAEILIQAEKRAVIGKKVKVLRREGQLPAVIYGHGIDPVSIVLDHRIASRTLAKASSSSLVTIELDGKQYPTLVREKQLDFIRNSIIHVDFLVVSLKEKIRAKVGVVLEGEAPAVAEFGAILITGLTVLEVECLAPDLPVRFTIDVSSLENISSGLYVRDIDAPEAVEILNDPNDMLVIATAPAVEEEEEVVEEELLEGEEQLDGPEVIDKGKQEDEEAEEKSE